MIRPIAKTYQKGVPNLPPDEEQPFGTDNFLGGLFPDADNKAIPDNCFESLENGVYVSNRLFKRQGLVKLAPAKPNTLPILGFNSYLDSSSNINLYRYDRQKIYKRTSPTWTEITGAGLSGANTDCFTPIIADNRLIFTNNGADVIQEINLAANTYAALGNAPKYKYITSAFNRIIGAYLKDVTDNSIQVGWSGDLNYAEWDPTVDISAGFTPLVDSPSDTSDQITGLFSLESCICITRQKSIWLGINQPAATNPFYFYASVPRVGADCPRSIKIHDKGLIFYSYHNSTVYEYIPNTNPDSEGQIVDISLKIKRFIKNIINAEGTSPASIFSSMNYETNTYTLFVPSAGALVYAFTYNRDTQAWSLETYNNITYCSDLDYPTTSVSTRFFGRNDGESYTQDIFTGGFNSIVISDDGSPVTFDGTSKTYHLLPSAIALKYLQIVITPYKTGTIVFNLLKDGTQVIVATKTVSVTTTGKQKIILIRRNIRCNMIKWSFTSNDCQFSLDGFKLVVDKAGIIPTN